jgi:tRNA G10  N-methylase Trm11
MLPPKLARIMVNLAATSKPEAVSGPIYDPFCGTGTILQEALVLGYEAAGSDLEPRMVDASVTNLNWLKELQSGLKSPLEVVARAADVGPEYQLEALATEGYLGPPISRIPSPEAIRMLGKELDKLYKGFWKAFGPVLGPGKRVVVCLPVFIQNGQPMRLGNVDSLGNPSYNLEGSYDYYREGQIVGRQIMIYRRK